MAFIKHVHTEIGQGDGPAGYLFNLRRALAESGQDPNIRIDVSTLTAPPLPFPARIAQSLRQRFTTRHTGKQTTPDAFTGAFARKMASLYSAYDRVSQEQIALLFDCDLLCVHDLFLAERLVRTEPSEARRKLVLMAHTATYQTHVLASALAPDVEEALLYAEPGVQSEVAREIETMRSVRTMLWPSEEAMEGFPDWQVCCRKSQTPNAFVETGVYRPESQTTPEAWRQQWGVGPEKRIVLFLGEPFPQNGFDRFAAWADAEASKSWTHWAFVQCGVAPATRRKPTSVQTVASDIGAACRAADLVVFPNRRPYGDLPLLEAMSLGARIVVSPTGGHGALARAYPCIPTIPQGDAAMVWPQLVALADEYTVSNDRQRQFVEIWQERFSPAAFYRNHLALGDSLLRKPKSESAHHLTPRFLSLGELAASESIMEDEFAPPLNRAS